MYLFENYHPFDLWIVVMGALLVGVVFIALLLFKKNNSSYPVSGKYTDGTLHCQHDPILLHRAVGSVLPVEIVDIAASEPFCQVRNDCLADAVAAECGHGLWITFMAACRPPGHPVNLGWPLCRNA